LVSDARLRSFETVIKTTHDAKAKLLARQNIREWFGGETVWEGEVLVFGLLDHPKAHLCYGWEEAKGRVTTILARGSVKRSGCRRGIAQDVTDR
jgi:hypothetical protein